MLGVLVLVGGMTSLVKADELYRKSTTETISLSASPNLQCGTFIPGASSRPGASITGPLAQTGVMAVWEPASVTTTKTTTRSVEQQGPAGSSATTTTTETRVETQTP